MSRATKDLLYPAILLLLTAGLIWASLIVSTDYQCYIHRHY